MDLTILEDPGDLRDHQLHLGIGNHLVKGPQGLWGCVVEYLVSNPSGIIKFCMNYNSTADGYG